MGLRDAADVISPARLQQLMIGLPVATLIALTGCGSDELASGRDGEVVVEGEYVATEVLENGQPKELVDGTTIRLVFSAVGLTASAGCNTIGGDYTVDDGVLQMAATSMTEMGCGPQRHAQDEWLVEVLSSRPMLEPFDAGFVLRSETVVMRFTSEDLVDPDVMLLGTTWVVDGYVEGSGPDGSTSSAPDDTARVVFDPNGFVTGHDGCNGFGFGGTGGPPTDGLRYEVTGSQITFSGSPVSTQIACPGIDTYRFWTALDGTIKWDIDGSRLTLINGQDRGITLRADMTTRSG